MSFMVEVEHQSWPIDGAFTIARGAKTQAQVLHVRVRRDGSEGVGEGVPYPRYGASIAGSVGQVRACVAAQGSGMDRQTVMQALAAGAARNALDAALWSWEARASGRSVSALAGLPPAEPVTTAFTLSLASAGEMAARAAAQAWRPLLQVKLGADGDEERIAAVREAAPGARLIVDANEGWHPDTLEDRLRACAQAGVELVEQPLPAAMDHLLEGLASPVPLCADESFHGLDSLDALVRRYRCVNLKLDKTGGLTHAMAVAEAVKVRGLALMVGCMVGTSLAMAPAFALSPWASYVDLDGPLLLARDRSPGFRYRGGTMLPAPPGLWD